MLACWQPDRAVTQCKVWCQIRRGVSLCLSCPHVNAETEFVKISTLEGVFQKLFTQMWTINWDVQGAGVIYFSHTNHIWPKFFNLSKFCHFFTLSFKLTAVVFCSIFSESFAINLNLFRYYLKPLKSSNYMALHFNWVSNKKTNWLFLKI